MTLRTAQPAMLPAGLDWRTPTPDRKGEHPQRRLRDVQGILQAEAYAGFNALDEGGRIVEAACWTQARRDFHDALLADASPLARDAIERLQPLFAIEAARATACRRRRASAPARPARRRS